MTSRTDVDFSVVFKALSNENRLKVFEIIRRGRGNIIQCRNEDMPDDIPTGAVCVCEILSNMEVTAPTLSHHLKELRIAGLVDVYNRGQWSYYNVREGILDRMADYFMKAQFANNQKKQVAGKGVVCNGKKNK